jgi:U4/U6 small nuclear ribonucleoprotein PRP3
MLTKKELKKARRLRRQAELKDKQEKIRLGILPPDPPKVKLSNLMRVLGNEAVLDPTEIERQVREQVQMRLDKHLQANEERKLTPEERAEKKRLKFQEDTQGMVHVAVFR